MTQSPVQYKGKHLCLMGKKLLPIAKRFGTPTYVYSSKRILEKLKALQEAFTGPVHIHYSVKANSNREVLRLLRKNGAHVDVVSSGEVKRALECGFKGRDIIFSGVGKSAGEIEFSLRAGILLFNVESPQELERIGQVARRLKKTARLSFRLNPDVNPQTHPYITTGFRENKFGMDRSFLPELVQILRRYKTSLQLMGVDFHIGSQLTKTNPFEEAVRKSIPIWNSLRSQGFPLRYFDIGGGVGISYEGQKVIDPKDYGRKLEKQLRPLGCEILCEPGRFIVADSGVLLTEVEYLKKTPSKNFVIVNTGMHHLMRPALYHAFHRIMPVEKRAGKVVKADVVGPICESSDWIAKKRPLVLPRQGDVLAILDAGAYGFVMASDYNLHEMPKEVVI